VATSLEILDIVEAQVFISAEGSSRAPDLVRMPAPPGCVTLARTQGTGGNLGYPQASRTAATPYRVGDSEGDRSLIRGAGGVVLAHSTCEVGEVARAATLWREGADRDIRKDVINSVSLEGNISGTRRLTC